MPRIVFLAGLPDLIIHHIQSLLPRKDALQMNVLSKRWEIVLDTYSSLDFRWCEFGENIILTDLEPMDLWVTLTGSFVVWKSK